MRFIASYERLDEISRLPMKDFENFSRAFKTSSMSLNLVMVIS